MLLRRTRLGLLAARELTARQAGRRARPGAARRRVMARELAWSEQRTSDEIDGFLAEASAEGIVVAPGVGELGALRDAAPAGPAR